MDDRTVDFDFDLPQERIAQHPVKPRDSARLLDVPCDPGAPVTDRHVRDLPGLLRAGDLLVANDTAVIPAQLHARRGEAKIGVTLDQHQADGAWSALIRNSKRLRVGDVLTFPGAADRDVATVVSLDGEGGATLRFSCEGEAFDGFLRTAGALALPPYIARPSGPTAEDEVDYRTIFAEHKGAVAAPTAGLHFTPELLARLDEAGVARETLTLHVGAGTFLPVRTETLSSHKMHSERGIITRRAADRINETRARGGRIVAVGTTSLRLLESAAAEDGTVRPFDGETSIFIHPGYRFRTVDLLMTNFHLPRSTLFMLVCAFAGTDRMRAAYAHAVEDGYRFYSYGDACLLRRGA
ncbi:tRNA preQ1(34) S-adenosylmethionine ribosyltransferase-isomerase QueA [Acetobacter fallax]|uniref:S-adenosylmethionine:tRNA ribosyltransferase-isomerase n=1 Tax=Acetobacter fallax TaxID=1737473 RepID=A0ABX0KAX5_9PROT|nr:tRNA preQ1(34) S-adenosylmethionine ribosyltransferase-isomerase QueA [Acetobacter fallax]NHO32343.1 tRNA preQ1(34) S-adenosylmethionine ribosyltransferase-isomerase QueA [Acetobacter fallax]NHO35989.1 tRNA preQ1(34) S-adenosylmethionine ribosyltransferase-isomerase QueA [Acetobacter fallax]